MKSIDAGAMLDFMLDGPPSKWWHRLVPDTTPAEWWAEFKREHSDATYQRAARFLLERYHAAMPQEWRGLSFFGHWWDDPDQEARLQEFLRDQVGEPDGTEPTPGNPEEVADALTNGLICIRPFGPFKAGKRYRPTKLTPRRRLSYGAIRLGMIYFTRQWDFSEEDAPFDLTPLGHPETWPDWEEECICTNAST